MRILLVSHPPLAAELGAAQVTLNLAAALRDRGHDALAWSPAPVPPGPGSFRRRQTEAIERFVADQGPFDVIDTPVTSASAGLARAGRLVVRSIQPELLYLRADLASGLRRPTPRTLFHSLAVLPVTASILAGWRRAHLILCFGSLELAWMRRRFPRWRSKLGLWSCALTESDRTALAALADIRRQREHTGPGVRFLWIGRWAAHKGTRRLQRFLAERLAAFPADSCTIAGCGPNAANAERDLPAEHLRSGRIRLVPSFPRAELPGLLAGHDAGLFTSEAEGWGISLNEMLESGLPVYATEAGGVPDLRPFFPGSLRPFPPPACAELEPAPPGEPADGYEETLTWPAIAREYERQVLPMLQGC